MLSESLVPFRFVNESNVHVPQNTNDSRKEISYTTISCVFFFLFVLYAARMLMVMLWHFFGVYTVTKLLGNAELFYGVQSCNSQEGVTMLYPFNFYEASRLLKIFIRPNFKRYYTIGRKLISHCKFTYIMDKIGKILVHLIPDYLSFSTTEIITIYFFR